MPHNNIDTTLWLGPRTDAALSAAAFLACLACCGLAVGSCVEHFNGIVLFFALDDVFLLFSLRARRCTAWQRLGSSSLLPAFAILGIVVLATRPHMAALTWWAILAHVVFYCALVGYRIIRSALEEQQQQPLGARSLAVDASQPAHQFTALPA